MNHKIIEFMIPVSPRRIIITDQNPKKSMQKRREKTQYLEFKLIFINSSILPGFNLKNQTVKQLRIEHHKIINNAFIKIPKDIRPI